MSSLLRLSLFSLLLILAIVSRPAAAQAEIETPVESSSPKSRSSTTNAPATPKPDRYVAEATEDATVYRKRDGKFLPVGKILAGEKVLVLNEYKNGKIWAVGNRKIKGFVKGEKFAKKINYDQAKRDKKQVFEKNLKEVWDDNSEAEDLITNHSGLRWGLSLPYDKEIGLGFGVPIFYGFAREGRRVEIGGELTYYAFNAGKPLQLLGFFRYMLSLGWFELGPEVFSSMSQLLALNNSRSYGYGAGAAIGIRFTNAFQFNIGTRVNFNKHVVPNYYGSLIFSF